VGADGGEATSKEQHVPSKGLDAPTDNDLDVPCLPVGGDLGVTTAGCARLTVSTSKPSFILVWHSLRLKEFKKPPAQLLAAASGFTPIVLATAITEGGSFRPRIMQGRSVTTTVTGCGEGGKELGDGFVS
jgi:hypothetical protein